MTLSHERVVSKFTDGDESGKGANIYIDGDVMYSYGYHFPLMVRCNAGYVLNADKYSVSTSQHQNLCFSSADWIVPFSAIENILPGCYGSSEWVIKEALDRIQIIDQAAERWDLLGYSYAKRTEVKPINITVGEYEKLSAENKNLCVANQERRPNATLLTINIPAKTEWNKELQKTVITKKGKTQYFLSSMDEGQFFICQLQEPCNTVSEAFEQLKPKECKGMVEHEDYERQGEWFFVDITEYIHFDNKTKAAKKRQYDILTSNFVLPRTDKDSNPHEAVKGGFITDFCFDKIPPIKDLDAAICVVSGQVRHPEHKMARLSTLKDIKFFAAFENTAVRSFSASGNVD